MKNFPVLALERLEVTYIDIVDKQYAASGRPILNKLFTFAPKVWKYICFPVSQGGKEDFMAFYGANKEASFDWVSVQEGGTVYDVFFNGPPQCRFDQIKKRWRIIYTLQQFSPL